MGKQTSVETRGIILDINRKGKYLREIGEIVGRHHCTIKKIIDKYAKYNTLENLPGARRPKCLTETEIRAIVRANPASSALKIADNIAKTYRKPVIASTFRKSLHQNGLHGRAPRKKPFISNVNQVKRLNFEQKYINQPQTFWNNILFTDESKFEILVIKKPPKIW